MSDSRLSMAPQEVRDVARGIERIVEDLRGAQERFAAHAEPAATGRDEVSTAVARTTSEIGVAQRALGETAVTDLRVLGEALTRHADTVQRQDSDLADTVRLEI
ncbi:PE domain-containing protein OS=Tsukamurella paurometabola (strain ATCC 8368 / DSM / CCUG 35730/ CIP 100753 / JCM 10117 / KCTC 9821 / NBRC 16120 / NCIMB 702349 / NCTC 13040) OX=521096 GN=Tpau_3373 PE=4 SV=1 [Tsukamurella paurometabola]|uniref:PE domain-containing protein n=1 Tax=Tsukamurella paurometabola (strain ATCC 8368 / DSM 20162 / CCUG 35730 / CIP 100753 / JCM 10117 / KCTC 9821 / NBRC 16120 / NCIMB 702349 / NCTC 13040) TaxID=521096 RepID=D5UWF8_TSUPD|nr:PE family protein [Tsukamurella paurometabola]ADG79957.1 hypothetical protein Tpau_3373 [Tsukamurella paurometabola DSM 20162]SUP37808.1 Uncharacterised protein [Tsukamurella paurometabola]